MSTHPWTLTLLTLLAVACLLASPGAAGEAGHLEQREPFATIAFPPHAEVGSQVQITIRTRGEAIAQPTRLMVDMHAMVGSARRAGLGTQSFDLTPGESETFVAKFTVPELAGILRLAFPIYTTEPGKGWAERRQATEVGFAVHAKGTPPPPPPPPPKPHPALDATPRPIEQPPVEVTSPVRADMVLNGPWRFAPATSPDQQIADDEWGQIWVPGSWKAMMRAYPGPIVVKDTGIWENFGEDLVSAWYEREVEIPADWSGRAIELKLGQVSTEAEVIVNGKRCGTVEWPGGTVDVTHAVTPGEEATIRVRVVAVETGGMEVISMGVSGGDMVRKARLDTRGLTGDVLLQSRPEGAHVDRVVLRSTVTDGKRLTALVTLRNAAGGEVAFTARLLDEQGEVEKTLTQRKRVEAADEQVVQLTWDWPEARLWDIGQPNLYTMHLEAKGAGLADVYPQRFGFREFRVDGKRFLLNGREVRLRPLLAPSDPGQNVGAIREALDGAMVGMKKAGANILHIWPTDPGVRGRPGYGLLEHMLDAADRHGMLITAPVPYFEVRGEERGVIDWTPQKRAAYQRTVETFLGEHLNHPSVVIWAVNANRYGLYDSDNPRHVGIRDWVHDKTQVYSGGWSFREIATAAQDALDAIREVDPTRAIMVHHGGYIGDIHATNTYFNMIPLQEREDWLSHYAEHGQMPFMPVEFGTPIEFAFMRGRTENWRPTVRSEPLATEFQAIYLGEAAYRLETDAYRVALKESYNPATKEYDRWATFNDVMRFTPGFQAFQELFITNTWRSWRTWGITGGMLPWHDGHAIQREWSTTRLGPFEPGRRGTYYANMPNRGSDIPVNAMGWWDPESGNRITPAGEALIANNGPTLGWIAGSAERFTAKDHVFFPGESIQKQVVLINDQSPEPLAYEATWSAQADGRRIDGGRLRGTIASGETVKLPIAFAAPQADSDRVDGVITLEATIGERSHADAFAFRVRPRPAASNRTLSVFDPEGVTSRYLESLGYATRAWDGSNVDLLIVGRNAMLADPATRPADLEAYVRGGGRVIIFNQDAEWSEVTAGLRTSDHVTRRAWPVASNPNPITAGLDGEDFRDWRGAGTAFPEEIGTRRGPNDPRPLVGWHWGNHGSVASSAPEKPHFSGWRPILQADFDLQYAPLMELRLGRGYALWCALDIEGRTRADPVAELVTRRLIDHASTAATREAGEAKITYFGDPSFRGLLGSMGLKTDSRPEDATLAIAGPGASEAAMAPLTQRGVPIVVFAQRAAEAPFGVTLEEVSTFDGSLEVPAWEEARGLSPSDLRLRAPEPWWVLAGGCEIAADGMLGRKTVGNSTVLFAQFDPAALDVEEKAYFRFTRWRQSRAIANLLANLGAAFDADANVFTTTSPQIALPTEWAGRMVTPLPVARDPNQHVDGGISPAALALVGPGVDDAGWQRVPVTHNWEGFDAADGEAVFRTAITVPSTWAGQDLQLSLGAIDDFDSTYWNGSLVGRTGKDRPNWWTHKRVYDVPGELVKPGEATIAVRIFDGYLASGISANRQELFVRLKSPPGRGRLYHPDYNASWGMGDNPHRWCPW